MGICWAGAEEQFEQLLLQTAARFKPFYYLEIGVAYCQTMHAVREMLRYQHPDYRLFGIDPADFALENFRRVFGRASDVAFYHMPREEAFKIWDRPVHFAVVDGCHSKQCVTGDFLAVERFAVPGTSVVFHDFQPAAQGGDMQPHCQAPVGVRAATEELGLLDNKRLGWHKLDDIKGDPARQGADCGVFEKHETADRT